MGIKAPGPLDRAIDEVSGARSRRATAVTEHASTAPDAHARVLQLADQLQVPPRAVAIDPATFEADRAREEFEELAARSPLLARWAEQPDNYAVAKDDLDNLSLLEELFGTAPHDATRAAMAYPDQSRNLIGGMFGDALGTGVAGVGRLTETYGRRTQDAPESGRVGSVAMPAIPGTNRLVGGALQDIGSVLRGAGDTLQDFGEWIKPPKERRGFVSDVQAGLGQIPMQIATGGVGLLGQGAEIAGERADAAGATQDQKDVAVVQGAAVTGITEKLGLGFLMRRLPDWAKKKLAGKVADVALGGLGEGAQEVVEGIGHDIVARGYDPDAVIGQGIATDFSVAAAVGTIARGALTGHARVRQIDDSEQGADWLQRVQAAAAASKTGQRRPEALAALVAELKAEGGPQHAYLSAEAFVGYYQDEREAFQAAQELTGNADALPAALAGQGDLAIPMERFVPFLGTHPEAAKQAKLAPDQLSGEEVDGLDREAEVQRVLADFAPKPGDVETPDATIEAELSTVYKPAEAKEMARLIPRFYDGITRITGATREEVQAKYPVKIVAERLAGPQLQQPPTRPDEVSRNLDPATPVPVVDLDAIEGDDAQVLSATKDALKELQGGGTISRDGRGKLLSQGVRHPIRHAVLRALDRVAASSVTHSDAAKTSNPSSKFEYAAAAIRYGGKTHPVRLAFQVGSDGVRRVYHVEGFREIEGPAEAGPESDAIMRGRTAEAELGARGPSGSTITLAEALEAFKNETFFHPADGRDGAGPRGAIQFPAAGIGNGPSLIHLAATANRSTFLHETGHFFLEVLGNEPKAAGEFQKILDWFGVKDAAAWHALDLEGKRPHHEKFARGFEHYLGEGKAPAPGLRTTFRKFKRWILDIYKDLDALDAPITDDIRGVFDRLLAADHEIEAAAAQQHYVAAVPVEEAAKLGITGQALVSYRAALERAKEALGAKFLQAKLREKKAWYRDQVKAEIARLAPLIRDQPVYQLRELIAGGRKLDAEATQLAAAFLTPGAALSEASAASLRGYTIAGGVSPDVMADLVGYRSTEAMLRDLIEAPPLEVAVREAAEQMVLQRHGDPLADARNEAMDALHNARLAQAMNAELALLAKLAGEAYYANPKVIDEAARRVAARQTARQLQPHQHLVAERKAANEAAKAAAKGKFAEALQHKRAQAFNAALYRHTRAAEKVVLRIRKRAVRLAKKPAQTRLAKAGHDYLAQVNDLLATYTFRQLSKKEVGRRQSLRAFVERLQESGEVTAIADALLARVEAERPVSFRDVPTAELLELEEALKNIEHLAGLKNKLLAGARKAKLDEAVAEMLERGEASLPEGPPDVVDAGDLTVGQRIAAKLRSLADGLTRPENIIEALDGGESGPWHDFLWHPQVAAENMKLALMQRLGTALQTLHAKLPADFWARTDAFVEFKGQRMKRYTLISAAFNLGNAGNRQRLRDGGISTVSGKRLQLTDADLAAIPALLTEAELAYVQGVWDAVDSLRPDIEALTRRMGGIPVAFVTAAPLTAVSVDGATVALRGGYWPLAYHHERSSVGERQADDDALRILMGAGVSRAATSKGHTKDRAETFSAPLLLNFGQVLSRSLDQVMTDLAYRESVRDTAMLLRDPRIKAFLHAKLGKAGFDSLNGGVAYSVSASADVVGLMDGGWRGVMDWTIANGVVSALAIRPDIALGNFASALVQGLDRVGKRALLRGMRRLALEKNTVTDEITALSPFMANRLGEIDHAFAKTIKQAQDGAHRKGAFRIAYFRLMMTLHRTADHVVTRALWWGRYEQERAAGKDPAEAVRLADKAIRQTQTSSGKKDVSTFERDPAFRQSRVFMGPMFVIFGRLRAAATGTGATREVGQRAHSLLLQWALAPAIFALAAGRAPDDDDDDGEWGVGEWGRWLALNVGAFPLQTIPIVRELATVTEALATDKPVSPRASPTAQAAGALAKATQGLVRNLEDSEDDGIDYDELTRDLVTGAAPLTGLPGSQYRKSDRATRAALDDPDLGATELAELIVYGKPVYSDPDR